MFVANADTEHMGEMFVNARKQTIIAYQAILRNIHEKPSIIAQTYNSSTESRPVVALRPLYLCLQCPSIMTEADRDLHFETKAHCFCGSICDMRGDEGLTVYSCGITRRQCLLRELPRLYI
jgi:hypothetical protein